MARGVSLSLFWISSRASEVRALTAESKILTASRSPSSQARCRAVF